jgi:hypothetical protein
MTLDDETARRIVREAVENVVWSGRYVELVRAGYAARDAEVEELRAEVQRAKEATREAHWRWEQASEAAEAFNSTLAKVREYVAQTAADVEDEPVRTSGDADRYEVARDVLAILDESPTERETPAKPEGWARCNVNAFHSKSAAYAAGYMNGWDARGGGSR